MMDQEHRPELKSEPEQPHAQKPRPTVRRPADEHDEEEQRKRAAATHPATSTQGKDLHPAGTD
jgi:hypothetical protein